MKRLVTLFGLIMALVVGVLVVFRSPPTTPPAPIVVMPQSYAFPRQRISFFGKWVPRNPSWAWLWRLKELIAGRFKTIDLTATFIGCNSSSEFFLTDLSLPKPQFTNAAGLKIWLLDDADMNSLRGRFKRTPGVELLASPRITTADGMKARLFSGTTVAIDGLPVSVGVSVDLLGRVRRESTDLTVLLTYSEAITNQPSPVPDSPPTNAISVQTGLAVAARLQIPTASGAFLLDNSPGTTNHNRIGVLLTITPPPSKK
jgi:hypothetical protein